jgi:hypothetical protein
MTRKFVNKVILKSRKLYVLKFIANRIGVDLLAVERSNKRMSMRERNSETYSIGV